MFAIKWCIFMALLLFGFSNTVDAQPLFWDLLRGTNYEAARNQQRNWSRENRRSSSGSDWGDICRMLYPTAWSSTGYNEPNCPP